MNRDAEIQEAKEMVVKHVCFADRRDFTDTEGGRGFDRLERVIRADEREKFKEYLLSNAHGGGDWRRIATMYAAEGEVRNRA